MKCKFKGKGGMGMASIQTHCADLSFPFKGKGGMGMGKSRANIPTHPHLSPPLEGEDEKCAVRETYPTSVHP